jgi:hypothetical protein
MWVHAARVDAPWLWTLALGHDEDRTPTHGYEATREAAMAAFVWLSGPGPCIHHWGIEVEDRDSYVAKIEANGGTIISEPGEGALKFRAPDGTVAEIVGAGRYNKKKAEKAPA